MSIGVPPMMRIIDCIQIQKYPPPTTRASTPPFENRREEERERHSPPCAVITAMWRGGGGMERSPWFSTRTSHASPDDGDCTFKPYYTVDDGAWDRCDIFEPYPWSAWGISEYARPRCGLACVHNRETNYGWFNTFCIVNEWGKIFGNFEFLFHQMGRN